MMGFIKLSVGEVTPDHLLGGFEMPFPPTARGRRLLLKAFTSAKPLVSSFPCGYVMAFPAAAVVFELFALIVLL